MYNNYVIMDEQVIDSVILSMKRNIKKLLLIKEKMKNVSYENVDDLTMNKKTFFLDNHSLATPKVYNGVDIINKLNDIDEIFDTELYDSEEKDRNEDLENSHIKKLYI